MIKMFLIALIPSFMSVSYAETVDLTDSQIAGVLAVANNGEIRTGLLAQQKNLTEEAETYADQMVREHSQSNTQLWNLTQSKNWVLLRSPLSQKLNEKAQESLKQLEQLPSQQIEFDRAYIQDQVQMHSEVLRLADEILLPSADSDEMKTFITDLRPHIVHHLEQAQQILQDLENQD